MKKLLLFGAALSLSLLLSGCYTVPKTGRTTLSFRSEDKLASAAAVEFWQIKQETPISQNPEYNERVQRVGERIAYAASEDLPDAEWEFVVFEDDEQINAFAMPGGKVAVYTGILKVAETDDELAIVIGHEVAHVAARHSNERMSQNLLKAGLITTGSLALQIGNTGLGYTERELMLAALGAGTTVGLLLPYSRHHENEADQIGLIYAAEAGYDPHAAITFWERMEALKENKSPEFLSTHPAGSTRIRKLWVNMPEALEIYRNR